jgi:hypothetical protein
MQESAGWHAHEVVGLYGDPDTTWGIGLELGFDRVVEADDVAGRLEALVEDHPHLGPCPKLRVVQDDGWDEQRAAIAAAPYAVDQPLVRLALDDSGRRLFVGAHHGACDGLGLVAVAGLVTGRQLVSRARGIGDLPSKRSFLRSSLARLDEAIRHPPPRFGPRTEEHTRGEQLVVRTLPRLGVGTVDLCRAIGEVFQDWNGPGETRHPLLVMGASRRVPGTLAPDRQTAYLRLRLDPGWDRDRLRSAFSRLAPEPAFPETSAGGIGPRITHVLRGRLGATAQLSNLGVVEGGGLSYGAMFAALSGPRAVTVGLVSTPSTTTVSLRTRGPEFGAVDASTILALIGDRLQTAHRERPAQ